MLSAFVMVFHERRVLSLVYVLVSPAWFLEPGRRKALDRWWVEGVGWIFQKMCVFNN